VQAVSESEREREQWREMGHRRYKFTGTFTTEALWHTKSLKQLFVYKRVESATDTHVLLVYFFSSFAVILK